MTLRSRPHARTLPLGLLCTALALLAFAADQATKAQAESAYLLSPPSPTMAHHSARTEVLATIGSTTGSHVAFSYTHVANAGVIFGLLESAPAPVPGLVFFGTSLAGLLVALFLMKVARASWPLPWVAGVFILAGVLGNLVDRLRLGYVIDWFNVRWTLAGWSSDIPTFNIADLCLAFGAAAGAALLWNSSHFAVYLAPAGIVSRGNQPKG